MCVGPESQKFRPWQRITAASWAIATVPFGRGAGRLLQALILDCLLQRRLLREDFWRWTAHMLLASGFILLILMHALDNFVTVAIFSDYASTLNPFMSLRNLFGAMVLTGAGIAVYRRRRHRDRRDLTKPGDRIAMGLLAAIIVSGFAVESTQILSASIFDEMVDDYFISDDEDEILALRAYWFASYGVRFSDTVQLNDPQLRTIGRELHLESCVDCHSAPQTAFVSYPLSRVLIPLSTLLDTIRIDIWLWYVHWLISFVALAYLPFSKFWHLFATPAQQIVSAVSEGRKPNVNHRLTARALGFDACTNCAVCSLHCSVKPAYRVLHNPLVLPSEKLQATRQMVVGKDTSGLSLSRLSEGSFICTKCHRCTQICPSGINLQDLWLSTEKDLINSGFPEPHIWIRRYRADEWVQVMTNIEPEAENTAAEFIKFNIEELNRQEAYSACTQCATCSSVCPVVTAVEDAQQDLDFTPQQVINLLRLNLKEIAQGTRMVWNCVTCYLCQENCPQEIKIADIFYELRNSATQNYGTLIDGDGQSSVQNAKNL